jgi:hypothetical protein
MPLDYANIRARGPRTGPRFCLIAFAGSAAGFVAWCILDFVLVRFAPSRIHDFDWLGLLFPVAVGIAGAVSLRHVELGSRLALSIVVAVLASVGAGVLVLFFGIPFHFSIGGKL